MTADGEVSPYLVSDMATGDAVEVRARWVAGSCGGAGQSEPVLLVGGGSGIAPLMAMVRSRRADGAGGPFQLLYSP